jgi:putative oxidoreductase
MATLIDRLPRAAFGAKLARYGYTAARVALGLVFTLAGASIFVLIGHPPPMPPGLAGTFASAFFASRWIVFVDLVEIAAGVLLLANRAVPFALVLLAALLSNILVFHVTMQPQSIPLPLVLTGLWFVLAFRHRATLMALLK